MRYNRPLLSWSTATTHLTGFGGWVFGAKRNKVSDNFGIDNSNENVINTVNNDNTGFGGKSVAMTGFASRASALKRRHRGKGQYEFARREAEKFLESEVPMNGTNVWMEKGTNALALAQLLAFFEIEPEPQVLSLITNKLLRMLEDTSIDGITRLSVAIVLSQRSELYMERIFSAVADVLNMTKRDEPNKTDSNFDVKEVLYVWNIIECAAKVMQRNNKHAPAVLNESLVQMTMAQLGRTPVTELSCLQPSLLRVYGWLVRIGKVEEANHILVALVEHTGEFYGYDFSTLMNSCLRHHQLCPLPLSLLHRLARVGLMYSTNACGRDVACILASTAKILGSLEPGKNNVTQRDVSELGGRMNMLLGEYEPRVLRFLDANDKLHWTHCNDVTSIVFAYEMGGRLRYKNVFLAYQGYVAQNVTRFEPQQLAMAAGILRRSQLLSRELAMKLGERIETVLGEFSLSEISHICCTFAPMSPTWMPEARAVASRLLTQECSSYTKLTLAMAFPDDEALQSTINYKEISGRQLVDAMTLASGAMFERNILDELVARLNSAQERFSPDDLRMIQASGRQELQTACMTYLSSRFAETEWTSDTLFSLPLATGIPHALNPAKALAAAKTVSVSPEQFVLVVELITGFFGEKYDEDMISFVVTGGEELLGEEKIHFGTVLRYLEAVHPLRKMHPGGGWLAYFNEKMLHSIRNIKLTEMKSLLTLFCGIFGDVAQQPLLQQTLNEVVFGAYSKLLQPDEDVAQVTVLIARMQNGMPMPPLTESTPMAVSVRDNAAAYPPELRDAVMAMSLPKNVETKRLGRFTLRAARALENMTPQNELSTQDVNAALDIDPFATSPETSAAATTTTTHTVPNSAAATTSRETPQAQTANIPPQEATGSSQEDAVDNTAKQQSCESFPSSSISAMQNEATPVSLSGDMVWNIFAAGATPNPETKQKEGPLLTKQQAEVPPLQPQPATMKPAEENSAIESSVGSSSYVRLVNQAQPPVKRAESGQQEEGRAGGVVVDSGVAEEEVLLRPRRTGLPRAGAHNLAKDPVAMPTASSLFRQNQQLFAQNAGNGSFSPTPSSQPVPASLSSWSSYWGAAKLPQMASSAHVNNNNNSNVPGNRLPGQQQMMQTPTMSFSSGAGSYFSGLNQHHHQSLDHQGQQQQQQQSAYKTRLHGSTAAPGNNLFVNPASSHRQRPVITKTNPTAKIQQPHSCSSEESVKQVYSENSSSTKQGVPDLNKKNSLLKTKGCNVNSADVSLGTNEQKNSWAEAVAQIVRRPKGENRRQNKSKSQRSLSEWLNTPSEHKVEDSVKVRAASPATPPAKGHSKEKTRRGTNKDNVSVQLVKMAKTRTAPSKVKPGKPVKTAIKRNVPKGTAKAAARTAQSILKKTASKKMPKKTQRKTVVKKLAGLITAAASAISSKKKTVAKKSLKKLRGSGRRK